MTSGPKPSLSIRKYIKWSNTFPQENTLTKVLTSPAPHHSFVDVRLLLVPLYKGPLPVSDMAAVDWAFAGNTEHIPAEGDSPPHDVFKHWVDSRHPDAAAVKDEGDFFPGAVPGESLERGEMVNPSSGQVEKYEECWIDGLSQAGDTHGWVCKWEGGTDPRDGRGLMIRIGSVIQGVLRVSDEVAVARWEEVLEGEEKGQKNAIAEIGNVKRFLAGKWDAFEVGDQAGSEDGQEWRCIEAW